MYVFALNPAEQLKIKSVIFVFCNKTEIFAELIGEQIKKMRKIKQTTKMRYCITAYYAIMRRIKRV